MEKVLLISHSGLNTSNNVGKTLSLLFGEFKREELSQLFFNRVFPDSDQCRTWYRISDMQMLKTILGKGRAGSEYRFSDREYDGEGKFYQNSVGRSAVRLLLRDIVWSIGRIDLKSLQKWVKDADPDILFLAPGYSCFIYKIAMKISGMLNIPLVVFWMDDFYHEKPKKYHFIDKARKNSLHKVIRKTIRASSFNYVVSEEMAHCYKKEFGKAFEVLYTPYVGEIKDAQESGNHNKVFLYAGGLRLGRNKILAELGKMVGEKGGRLLVFSDAADPELTLPLKRTKGIIYGGFISQSELKKQIGRCDVIVHVESFDRDFLSQSRFSISTKIPECLASGKLILAVGPKEQASVNYLLRNKAAVVCCDKEELKSRITDIFSEEMDCHAYIKNAKSALCANHEISKISKKIRHRICLIREAYNESPAD